MQEQREEPGSMVAGVTRVPVPKGVQMSAVTTQRDENQY